MPRDRVVIVGAGVAGLVSAFALAARGLDVTVLERSTSPGGKMRQVAPHPGAAHRNWTSSSAGGIPGSPRGRRSG